MRGSQETQDFFQHDISLFQRVVRYSQKAEVSKAMQLALPVQHSASAEFHYQALPKNDEINDVQGNRRLSPKIESAKIAILKAQFCVG